MPSNHQPSLHSDLLAETTGAPTTPITGEEAEEEEETIAGEEKEEEDEVEWTASTSASCTWLASSPCSCAVCTPIILALCINKSHSMPSLSFT